VIKGDQEHGHQGTPAIGIAAAMGLALGAGAIQTSSYEEFQVASWNG